MMVRDVLADVALAAGITAVTLLVAVLAYGAGLWLFSVAPAVYAAWLLVVLWIVRT